MTPAWNRAFIYRNDRGMPVHGRKSTNFDAGHGHRAAVPTDFRSGTYCLQSWSMSGLGKVRAIRACRCLLWVISRLGAPRPRRLQLSRKRTSIGRACKSALCQKRTFAGQKRTDEQLRYTFQGFSAGKVEAGCLEELKHGPTALSALGQSAARYARGVAWSSE